jgi:hypothetical protein
MKQTLIIVMLLAAVAVGQITESYIVNYAGRRAPDIETYQANSRIYEWTLINGSEPVDLTGLTPFMWWAPSATYTGVVPASISVVNETGGVFRATFAPADLNYAAGSYVYAVGFNATGGTTTARMGSYKMLPDIFATGVDPIHFSQIVNWEAYTWLNVPAETDPHFTAAYAAGLDLSTMSNAPAAWTNLPDLSSYVEETDATYTDTVALATSAVQEEVDPLSWHVGDSLIWTNNIENWKTMMLTRSAGGSMISQHSRAPYYSILNFLHADGTVDDPEQSRASVNQGAIGEVAWYARTTNDNQMQGSFNMHLLEDASTTNRAVLRFEIRGRDGFQERLRISSTNLSASVPIYADGSGITDVDAETLDGLDSTDFVAETNTTYTQTVAKAATAYGWGDHADAGYATTATVIVAESDPVFEAAYSNGLDLSTMTNAPSAWTESGTVPQERMPTDWYPETTQTVSGTATFAITNGALQQWQMNGAVTNFVWTVADTNAVTPWSIIVFGADTNLITANSIEVAGDSTTWTNPVLRLVGSYYRDTATGGKVWPSVE